jgi:hypothetical protein
VYITTLSTEVKRNTALADGTLSNDLRILGWLRPDTAAIIMKFLRGSIIYESREDILYVRLMNNRYVSVK